MSGGGSGDCCPYLIKRNVEERLPRKEEEGNDTKLRRERNPRYVAEVADVGPAADLRGAFRSAARAIARSHRQRAAASMRYCPLEHNNLAKSIVRVQVLQRGGG